MAQTPYYVSENDLIAGWDFSTGAVKCLLFTRTGEVAAEIRLPTDLWGEDGIRELNIMQLEGQARASVRAIARCLRDSTGQISARWVAGGISATHHTAGLIDGDANQVRRMICWNDQTLGQYHAEGLARLGGQDRVKSLIGGPWAVRYSLSHLVKDEQMLIEPDWNRIAKMLPHGPLAGGYLTDRFDVTSVSSAASTGIMNLATEQWQPEMLDAIQNPAYREIIWAALPRIQDMNEPLGPLAAHIKLDAGLNESTNPLLFPTLDDQAAGLIGGGAVDAGQVAIILGNSAVVNSSAATPPQSGSLDAMKLNWGMYLWMRCYSNGAQFLDRVVGTNPDWAKLEAAARAVPPGCNGITVSPFVLSEPSIGIEKPRFSWSPNEPCDEGVRVRASFEALAYLIALAVKEHEAAGQKITRITVSGGIAKNDLMLEILASVLDKPLERLVSNEGSALGAAVCALAGYESFARRNAGDVNPFTASDAVACMVRFRGQVQPRPDWVNAYSKLSADGFQLAK